MLPQRGCKPPALEARHGAGQSALLVQHTQLIQRHQAVLRLRDRRQQRRQAARAQRQQTPPQPQAQLRPEGGLIHPVRQQARAFAPATVANLGVGFDWLGCAVEVGANGIVADGIARSLEELACTAGCCLASRWCGAGLLLQVHTATSGQGALSRVISSRPQGGRGNV